MDYYQHKCCILNEMTFYLGSIANKGAMMLQAIL